MGFPVIVWGQVAATAPGISAPIAPGVLDNGPARTSDPATAVASGRPGAGTAGQALTLLDVVARVLGNNSGLELARQRLQRAQESINQVNAQIRPQFRLNANNTYSSYPAFPSALPVPTITTPALPDGGQIPTIVDQANSFSTAFVGSGSLTTGGGGSVSPGTVGGTTGTAGTSGTGAATPGTAGPPAPTTGTASPGTTSPGTGGAGTGADGNGANGAGNTPAAGTTTPTTGNTPGTGATVPDTGTGAASPGANAPARGTSPAAPNGGTNAPAAPAAGTGATGMAPFSYPLIVADYVTDRSSLLPVSPAPEVPAARPPAARRAANAEPAPARTADADTGTGGASPMLTAARGKRDTYAAGGNVTQYIDLFGLVGAARSAEQDTRDFYALDIVRLQNETALAAKNLFFNVLYAQSLVATQQEQVAYAQENVRITESRLRNGIVSRFDVLTAQAALATAQQQFTAAQDQYELAQSELAYLIGSDPDQPQTLQPPVLPPLTQNVDLRQSTRLAEQRRPELAEAGHNVDNARHQARLAQAGLLPTLGFVGSGEYTSNGSTITPRSYGTVSVQAAVPLDDGGLTRSRVRSAQVQTQVQTLLQEQLQLSVALEVRQATVNIRSAQAEAASAEVGVARSQEALRLARERYGAGLGTFLDVLNALAQLATARTNLANSQYFYQSSLAQLVRVMGGR